MIRNRLELKYTFHCGEKDLFQALKNPNFMRNWIADEVDHIDGSDQFTLHWGDSSETYQLLERDEKRRYLKFHSTAEDSLPNEYISFEVGKTDEAGYVDLYIHDFCDKEEEKPVRETWDQSMKKLSRALSL